MHTRFRFVAPALAALLIPAPALFAQTAPELLDGTRVRFRAPTVLPGRVTGRIATQDDTTLTIEVDDHRPVRVPRDAVRGLEVSTGRAKQWKKGMLIGSAVNAAMFAALVDPDPTCDNSNLCMSRGAGAASGAIIGALYGAGVGALFRADRWTEARSTQVHVQVAPAPGRGVQAALAVGF